MKRIRISYFDSAAFCFILALIYLLIAPIVIGTVKSEPNGADVIVPLCLLFYGGVGVWLCFAIREVRYYILTVEGISVCLLGITYRKVKWEDIFDIMIGPDPLIRATPQTLLLNCLPEKKYRPRMDGISFKYEKSFYKDLGRGKIIRLCCGKKLDSVLMLLDECVSEDVMQQMTRY